MRRLLMSDHGLGTTELVVLFPAILLVTLMPVHLALFWHARQMTDLAAGVALDAAVVEGAVDAEAVDEALSVLDRTGQVLEPAVVIDRSGEDVTVSVQGRARFRVLPGRWTVRSTASGRLERFLTDAER